MSPVDEMSCQELVELVTDYLEDALSETEQVRFEEHLGTCPHCGNHIEQMTVTIGALGRLRADQLDGDARDELLTAFRDWAWAR